MVVAVIKGITVVTPEEGFVLRRKGSAPGDPVTTEAWLAPADSPDNWEDVDPEETADSSVGFDL